MSFFAKWTWKQLAFLDATTPHSQWLYTRWICYAKKKMLICVDISRNLKNIIFLKRSFFVSMIILTRYCQVWNYGFLDSNGQHNVWVSFVKCDLKWAHDGKYNLFLSFCAVRCFRAGVIQTRVCITYIFGEGNFKYLPAFIFASFENSLEIINMTFEIGHLRASFKKNVSNLRSGSLNSVYLC